MSSVETESFFKRNRFVIIASTILMSIMLLVIANGIGVFDSAEIKAEKEAKRIAQNAIWDERREFIDGIKERISTGNLSCEYIEELLEHDSRVGDRYSVTDISSLEKGLRLYWNANSCGFEWNWYD